MSALRRTSRRVGPPPGDSARLGALRLLGRRDYSAAELKSRLIDRGYPAEDVERALAELVADGSVDDRRLAGAYVRAASRIKGRGRLRIRRELEARGIAAGIAAEAVNALRSDEEDEVLARLIARKRGQAILDPAARRRLFAQLLRRGFSAELIKRALKFNPDREE